MEIVLSILVFGLIVESVVSRVLNSRERVEMAKIYKARDVKEMDYMLLPGDGVAKGEDAFEENPNLMPLDAIPEDAL